MTVPHLGCTARRALVLPPLDDGEARVVRELAGAPGSTHRIWVGQPGPRSPWVPCDRGCCLELVCGGTDDEPAVLWLRFLVREVLAPRSARALARAAAVGITVRHEVIGGRPRRTAGAARTGPRTGRGEVVHPGPDGPAEGA